MGFKLCRHVLRKTISSHRTVSITNDTNPAPLRFGDQCPTLLRIGGCRQRMTRIFPKIAQKTLVEFVHS